MPDYLKGKIYTLRDLSSTPFYVGATCQSLSKRKGEHKKLSKTIKDHSRPVHHYINKVIGIDDFFIELHEHFQCKTKDELAKREGEVAREYVGKGFKLQNKQMPGRSRKQWHQENKDRRGDYNVDIDKRSKRYKRYQEKNSENIKERKKEKITCECSAVVSRNHLYEHRTTNKHKKLMEKQNIL